MRERVFCSRRKYFVEMFSIIIAIALLTPTNAWYTCEDLEFCTNIYNSDDTTSYSLTNVVVATRVQGRLVNDQTSEVFAFTFYALEGDTFRLKVQDQDNSRYTPEDDVLDGTPTERSLSLVSTGNGVVVVSAGDDVLINLYTTPFRIEVSKDDRIIIEVNKSNRLIINSNEDDQSLALDVSFPLANAAYGIPAHAEDLSLPTTTNGSLYRLFNVDYAGYPTHTRESLYGAIGVLYGISTDITSGLFWMNSAQTFVDIDNDDDGLQTLFISESGSLELFLFTGPTLRDCVRQYTTLTGVTPLPQYFTLGYHQSRYSYMSQEDVETVVAEFDNNSFPMDVIWLDIDYTDGYKYFTWNYTAFPDPEEMQENVAATGRKIVAISDPHIKVEEGYFVFDEALAQDYFVKNPDGSVYQGNCWPGLSSYVDFFNSEAQDWYGELYLLENFQDSTLNLYIWNDMNEPSVFDVDEQTMPGNLLHYGDIQHRDVHNLYGFKQTQSTFAGLLKRDPSKRPFILSRAHFAGSQRYSAIWTGDNVPSWEHLRISIPMILTESLAGMVFCGADVGGFTDNVDEELLQRWHQVGTWYPFLRQHSSSNTERREPYLYSEEIQQRIRSSLRLRYVHIPYWYTLFFEHELTGDPVVRPLSYHYPDDESVLSIDTQWLIGSDIMAAPVLNEGVSTITTYFPGGQSEFWFDISNQLVYIGDGNYDINIDMDSAPYYYRGGSIILRKDEDVGSTEEQHDLSYNMYIFLDGNSEATGNIYVDDLESYDYRNQIYLYYRFTYNEDGLSAESLHDGTSFDGELIINQTLIYSPATSYSRSGSKIQRAEITLLDENISIKNLKTKITINL